MKKNPLDRKLSLKEQKAIMWELQAHEYDNDSWSDYEGNLLDNADFSTWRKILNYQRVFTWQAMKKVKNK